MYFLVYYFLLFITALVSYLICKAGPWLYKVHQIRKALEPLYACKPHWLKGHLSIAKGPTEKGLMKMLEWTEQFPRFYTLTFPFRPLLVLNHPDTLKQVLKTSEPKGYFPACGWSYWMMRPWLGDGLLLSNGKKWFRNRRLLTPAFHFDILKPYVHIFNGCSENLMNHFEEVGNHGQKSVEIFKPISLCGLNTILKCAFSAEEAVSDLSQPSTYISAIYQIAQMIKKRQLTPLHYLDRIYFMTAEGKEFLRLCDITHSVAMDVIIKRKAALQTDANNNRKIVRKQQYVDFLDILLLAKDEDGNGLTDKEILDEVETFMFEGHDTVTSAFCWTMYNLAKYPEYQQKAREEVDQVFSGKDHLEWEDLAHLPYLTMCIKESMRMYPPVPQLGRELTKPMTFDGHTVEAGTPVELNVWAVHHNPTVWGEDHMTYDPERFHPDRISKVDSYAFVPFSAGPRNCIGQVFALNELKTNISRMLHEYEFRLDETHKIELAPQVILRSKHGIKLYFKRLGKS